jgi:hypothetical protein
MRRFIAGGFAHYLPGAAHLAGEALLDGEPLLVVKFMSTI